MQQALAKTRGGFLSRLFGRKAEEPATPEFLGELKDAGETPLLAGADTFRAAAIEQLETWAARVGVPIVSGRPDGDPAAVVFDAVNAAVARGNTTVIADTAGRLHTKGHLMDELSKIVKVTGRARAGAPGRVRLVLDGTAGQNAIQQARQFTK